MATLIYTGPIELPVGTTVLKIRAVAADGTISDLVTEEYVVINAVEIDLTPANCSLTTVLPNAQRDTPQTGVVVGMSYLGQLPAITKSVAVTGAIPIPSLAGIRSDVRRNLQVLSAVADLSCSAGVPFVSDNIHEFFVTAVPADMRMSAIQPTITGVYGQVSIVASFEITGVTITTDGPQIRAPTILLYVWNGDDWFQSDLQTLVA